MRWGWLTRTKCWACSSVCGTFLQNPFCQRPPCPQLAKLDARSEHRQGQKSLWAWACGGGYAWKCFSPSVVSEWGGWLRNDKNKYNKMLKQILHEKSFPANSKLSSFTSLDLYWVGGCCLPVGDCCLPSAAAVSSIALPLGRWQFVRADVTTNWQTRNFHLH